MQTFLTHTSLCPGEAFECFFRTAKDLDWMRLGKQRVEAFQILNTLEGKSEGWRNHPAVKMWRSYIPTLKLYHDVMIYEWQRRGYRNAMKSTGFLATYFRGDLHGVRLPDWLTPDLVLSHQSNLIRKRPDHYSQLYPGVPDDLPYVWPVT